eukprot:g45299.t1
MGDFKCRWTGKIREGIRQVRDHNMIEFTLQFEGEKLEPALMVLQLSKVEGTSSVPELQESHGAEVSVVAFMKNQVLRKLKGLKMDKSPSTDGLQPRVLNKIAEEIVEVASEPPMVQWKKSQPIQRFFITQTLRTQQHP